MTKRKVRRLLDEAKEEHGEGDVPDIQVQVVGVDSEANPIGDPIVTGAMGNADEEIDPSKYPECRSDDCENPVTYPRDFEGYCEKCYGRPEDTWPSWVE